MGKYAKLREQILGGSADSNIPFAALRQLLKRLNFAERVRGDHYIYTRADIVEIVNIQPIGSKAKAYQVKQIRNIMVKYRLGDTNVD